MVAPNNIAFDTNTQALDVNSAFGFDASNPNPDTGTTYDGTSGLLTTRAQVTPGTQVELVLSIMDLGDSILDSAALVDNFRWTTDPPEKCKPGAQPIDCTPDDELFGAQWNLKAIDVLGAWEQFPSCNPPTVRVGVIDTGANKDHDELKGRISSQTWYVTNNGGDQQGHGTQVTGLIAANRNNSIGVSGVHPNAEVYTYKVQADAHAAGAQIIWNVSDAIREAVDDGVQVVNVSLGTRFDWREVGGVGNVRAAVPCLTGCEQDGLFSKALKYAQDHGVIVVIASGNTGTTETQYPAAYSSKYWNVIAVAASTVSGKSWTNKTCVKGSIPFTQNCASNTTGAWVTLTAPGGVDSGVNKCTVAGDDCIPVLALNSGTQESIGTSLAAPQVTGVVALMIAANPSVNRQNIRHLLHDSVTPFSSSPDRPSGAGILNASRAVALARLD